MEVNLITKVTASLKSRTITTITLLLLDVVNFKSNVSQNFFQIVTQLIKLCNA